MADFSLMGILGFKDNTKPGTDSAKKGVEGLKGAMDAAKKVMTALAVVETVKLVAEFTKLGATANAVEKRFVALAGGEAQAEEFMRSIRTETNYTVDAMTAMQAASKYMSLGLADTADGAASLIGMASRLGDQTQSTQQRIDDFGALLANQSIPRLDNFGISSAKVRARIKELQTEFVGMSREAAFNQAVLEQGAVAMDRLGDSVDNQAATLAEAEAVWKDFKTTVVTTTADVIVPAIRGFNEIVNYTTKVNDALADNTKETIKNGTTWEEYSTKQLDAQITAGRHKDLVDEFNDVMWEQGYSIGEVNDMLTKYGGVTQTATALGIGLGETMSKNDYLTAQYGSTIATAMIAQQDYNTEMGDSVTYTEDSALAVDQYNMALQMTETSSMAATLAQRELDAATQAAADSAALAAVAFNNSAAALSGLSMASFVSAQIAALKEQMDTGAISATEFAAAQEALLVTSGELTTAEQSTQATIDSLTASFAAGRINADTLALGVLQAKEALDALDGSTVAINFDYKIPALPDFAKPGSGEDTAVAFAQGGTIPTNGPVLVGENGPEFISGAGGARVMDNTRSSTQINNWTVNNNSAVGMERLLSESRRSRMMNVQL
jgi:hypothetical protein